MFVDKTKEHGKIWNKTAPSLDNRTREGCDHMPVDSAQNAGVFQSTHPRGVRLS